jgi:hypothetical protein
VGISQTPQAIVPAAFSSGGFTLIQETVASTNTSINFSSIPATYKQLYLTWSGLFDSNSNRFSLRINNDSGSNYNWYGFGNWSSGTYSTFTGPDVTSVMGNSNYLITSDTRSTELRYRSIGYFLLDNYASTTMLKKYEFKFSFNESASFSPCSMVGGGVWNSTSAVTSLDIVRLSGTGTLSNATNTSIRLYGIS